MGAWCALALALALLVCAARAEAALGPLECAVLRAPAAYRVTSTVLLGGGEAASRRAGYQVRGDLLTRALWPPHGDACGADLLLELTVLGAGVWARGAGVRAEWAPRESAWGRREAWRAAALWRGAALHAVYLPRGGAGAEAEQRDYLRSLAALLQLRASPGAANETDVSGRCEVAYELAPEAEHTVRKVKSRCRAAGEQQGEAQEELVSSRRVTSYTLSAARDAVEAVFAEEVHEAAAWGAAVGAHAWHSLRRTGTGPAPGQGPGRGAARALDEAVAALGPELAPSTLQLEGDDEQEVFDEDEAEARAAWSDGALLGALLDGEPGAGGTGRAAGALLALLPALRAANATRLRGLLARHQPRDMPALARLLGLAGTRAAHEAAAAHWRITDRDTDADHGLLHDEYFAALAHAPHPDEWVVREAVRLGVAGEAWSARRAARALLGAAGAARRAGRGAREHVRLALAAAVSRCLGAECRALRLLALGDLRRGECAEALAQWAAAPGGGRAAALAALAGLARLPARAAASAARVRALLGVALSLRAPAALEVRAGALAVLVRWRAWAALGEAARALQEHGPRELLRWLRQRVAADAPDLLALLPAEPGRWTERARAGTSSVLVRSAGWSAPASASGSGAGSGWGAALHSAQLAAAGVLRQGTVRLVLGPAGGLDEADERLDALQVQLWTRGMETLAGGTERDTEDEAGEEAGEEEEGALEAWLSVSVFGAQSVPARLFGGQGELLGLVWSGAGSEPTAVSRAALAAPERCARVPLCAGRVLRVRARAAAALALDAHAQVSLWARSAAAALELRAAGRAEVRAALGGGGAGAGRQRAEARAADEAEPRLSIEADLDFSGVPALCVRAYTAQHDHWRNSSARVTAGARRWRVRLRRGARHVAPPRTLALGTRNDAACSHMHA